METQEHEQEQDAGNGETTWAEAAAASEQMQGHRIEEHVRDAERIIEVPLTDEELADRARRMAELRKEVGNLEQEKKDAASRYKEKIDRVNGDVDEVAEEVRNGTRPQCVAISEGVDGTGHNMVTVRKDTGAVIDVRPLTPDERQGRFDFVESDGEEEQDDEGGDNVVTHPAEAKPSLEDLDGHTKAQLVDVADRWKIDVDPKLTKADILDAVRRGLYPSFAPAEQGETEDQGDGDDAS